MEKFNKNLVLIVALLGFIFTSITFYQAQRGLVEEQQEQFTRLKFEVEKIQNLTSNDKMAEYYKLQQIVYDNKKRISALEKDLKDEIKGLSLKIDKLLITSK